MSKYELYKKAYDILSAITPLHWDCGRLCNRACCDSADKDAGMYLYPGEEVMYSDTPDWLRIQQSAFTYGNSKPVLIAICSGKCDRLLRPLSCRVFPLTPYVGQDGALVVKTDPRAVPICPLAAADSNRRLNREFINAVEDVFKLLAADEEIKSYIYDLSRLIDEQESIIHLFTAGQKKKKTGRRRIRSRI